MSKCGVLFDRLIFVSNRQTASRKTSCNAFDGLHFIEDGTMKPTARAIHIAVKFQIV